LEQNENSTIATTNAKGNKIQSNTLVIESATEADNGKYFCVITGDDGYVGYRSAQLNVIPRPAETSPIFFETTLIVFAGIFVFLLHLLLCGLRVIVEDQVKETIKVNQLVVDLIVILQAAMEQVLLQQRKQCFHHWANFNQFLLRLREYLYQRLQQCHFHL
jgi:hypothetical protein